MTHLSQFVNGLHLPSASLQFHQTSLSSSVTPDDPTGGITFSVSVRARKTRGLLHQWQGLLLCPHGRSLLKCWHTPSYPCSSAAAKAGCVPAELVLLRFEQAAWFLHLTWLAPLETRHEVPNCTDLRRNRSQVNMERPEWFLLRT